MVSTNGMRVIFFVVTCMSVRQGLPNTANTILLQQQIVDLMIHGWQLLEHWEKNKESIAAVKQQLELLKKRVVRSEREHIEAFLCLLSKGSAGYTVNPVWSSHKTR